MKESDERFFHRITCPNRGYEGSCLSHSGMTEFNGEFCHILRGCGESIDCDWMKEFDNKHKTEQTHENA